MVYQYCPNIICTVNIFHIEHGIMAMQYRPYMSRILINNIIYFYKVDNNAIKNIFLSKITHAKLFPGMVINLKRLDKMTKNVFI